MRIETETIPAEIVKEFGGELMNEKTRIKVCYALLFLNSVNRSVYWFLLTFLSLQLD
jgi:hypothetical protein